MIIWALIAVWSASRATAVRSAQRILPIDDIAGGSAGRTDCPGRTMILETAVDRVVQPAIY